MQKLITYQNKSYVLSINIIDSLLLKNLTEKKCIKIPLNSKYDKLL